MTRPVIHSDGLVVTPFLSRSDGLEQKLVISRLHVPEWLHQFVLHLPSCYAMLNIYLCMCNISDMICIIESSADVYIVIICLCIFLYDRLWERLCELPCVSVEGTRYPVGRRMSC